MARFGYKFSGFDLPSLSFHQGDMARVGQAAVEAQRDRLSHGLNVSDLPAMPLSKPYHKQKVKAGKQPVRDWNFTGETLAGLRAESVDGKAVVIFEGPAQKIAALTRWNATREQMAGLSPRDQERVSEVQVQILREKVTIHE